MMMMKLLLLLLLLLGWGLGGVCVRKEESFSFVFLYFQDRFCPVSVRACAFDHDDSFCMRPKATTTMMMMFHRVDDAHIVSLDS